MKVASQHPREEERLKDLARLELLDTSPEDEFDDITQLASYICNVPFSLISLIDRERQWFKSVVGFNIRETPRDIAFCAHAILQEQVYEISDASGDNLFKDNPLVIGEPFILHYAGAPIYGPEGFPIGTLCVINNQPGYLSEDQRKSLVQLSNVVTRILNLRYTKLLAEREKLRHHYASFAVRNMADGVIVQDIVGYVVAFNPAALEMLGLSEEQIVSDRAAVESISCVHEDGSLFMNNQHPTVVARATGVGQHGVLMGVPARNGEVRWVRVTAEPVVYDGSTEPTHVVTTLSDVTEEKQKQAMLLQSAKLTSLGQMAGGIAHEINTPLTTILLNTGLLRTDIRSGNGDVDAMEKRIEKIEKTTCRIESIIRGLSTFARDSSGDPLEPVNLHLVIEEGLTFFRERASLRGVYLDVDCDSSVNVWGVRHQVAQVIVSLVANSFDAVEGLSERWVRVIVSSDESKASITVVDSGTGIAENIVDSIMTPFFTTKEVGKAMGLGLSISRGMIEDMGGTLYYRPSNGHTAFHIELPLHNAIITGVQDVAC